jgi:hypothetical protein
MSYYLTWDFTGEYLWLTTPYKNKELHVWEAEHTNPENKIPVKPGTLEFHCWECVNLAFPPNILKLDQKQLNEVLKHAIT